MTQTFLLTMAVVIEVPATTPDEADDESFRISQLLRDAVNEALGPHPDYLGWVSTRFQTIDDPDCNSGQCTVCDAWTTDRERPDPIMGLHDGARIDGQLLCDDHLPRAHRWAF
jgi:hypothetical protein